MAQEYYAKVGRKYRCQLCRRMLRTLRTFKAHICRPAKRLNFEKVCAYCHHKYDGRDIQAHRRRCRVRKNDRQR